MNLTASPIDIVELVKVVFAGLTTLTSAFAGIYALVAARRAKRAEENAAAALATSADTHTETLKTKAVIEAVKVQTDGINLRLEATAQRAQDKADVATEKLAVAKVEVAVVTEKLEAATNGNAPSGIVERTRVSAGSSTEGHQAPEKENTMSKQYQNRPVTVDHDPATKADPGFDASKDQIVINDAGTKRTVDRSAVTDKA